MDDDLEYECPECGAILSADAKICKTCKAEFEQEEDEKVAVDDLLEKVTKLMKSEDEVIEYSASDEEKEPPYDPSPKPEDVEAETPYDPSPEPEEVEASASDEAIEVPEEVAPMAPDEPVMAKKTKALSVLGMVFAALAVISIIGLMVVLNYDVWINGDADNNIGDTQMMYVYLAVVGVIVCIMIVVVDLVRNRKSVKGAAAG